MEVSDGRRIPCKPVGEQQQKLAIRQRSAALSLSDNQTANRVESFFRNWNLVVQQGQPTELIKGAIQSLISDGAILVVDPCQQQFISTLFLVEKGPATGEFHPVINLKALNRILSKEKFKVEGLHTAHSLLRRGDYMMKLDLKDPYYALPIHTDSNIFVSSSRGQLTNSVAFHSAFPWLLESSPEFSNSQVKVAHAAS